MGEITNPPKFFTTSMAAYFKDSGKARGHRLSAARYRACASPFVGCALSRLRFADRAYNLLPRAGFDIVHNRTEAQREITREAGIRSDEGAGYV